MPFRRTSVSGAEFYSCICDQCGHAAEPLAIERDWASTVGERYREQLARRGWGFQGDQAWCVICWRGMERIIADNIRAQGAAA